MSAFASFESDSLSMASFLSRLEQMNQSGCGIPGMVVSSGEAQAVSLSVYESECASLTIASLQR